MQWEKLNGSTLKWYKSMNVLTSHMMQKRFQGVLTQIQLHQINKIASKVAVSVDNQQPAMYEISYFSLASLVKNWNCNIKYLAKRRRVRNAIVSQVKILIS